MRRRSCLRSFVLVRRLRKVARTWQNCLNKCVRNSIVRLWPEPWTFAERWLTNDTSYCEVELRFAAIHVKSSLFSFFLFFEKLEAVSVGCGRQRRRLFSPPSHQAAKWECVDYYCCENSSCDLWMVRRETGRRTRNSIKRKRIGRSMLRWSEDKSRIIHLFGTLQSKRNNCVSRRALTELIITCETRAGDPNTRIHVHRHCN